jgi:hypothetical protein
MMRNIKGEVYIYTKMGKFIVDGGKISYCAFETPQINYDQYGNCIDHVKRVITNVAGETMELEPESTDGMLLNNGLVAINYDSADEKWLTYKIFDCSNFKLISKHDGYFCHNEYRFCDRRDADISPPVSTGITSFVKKTIDMKEREIYIRMHSCSEDLITCRENNGSFEFTIIPYNLTFSTEKIEEPYIEFNVYLYENFIITDWNISYSDNPLTNCKLEFILMDLDGRCYGYEIESKGHQTKAAARAELD